MHQWNYMLFVLRVRSAVPPAEYFLHCDEHLTLPSRHPCLPVAERKDLIS